MKRKLGKLQPRTASLGASKGVTKFSKKLHNEDTRERKRFYDSKLWDDTRRAKLARDPLCQCCKYQGKDVRAEHVDHWTPLADAGHRTHDDNLVSLCLPCHTRKTMCEREGKPFPSIAPSAPRSSFGFA